MELSTFLLRAVFLALPGIISSKLYRTLRGDTKRADWESFLEIALFSLLSYSIYGVILGFFDRQLIFFQALFDENLPLAFNEIAIASLISLPLALIASFIYKKKLINTIGRRLNVTERIGVVDIWDYFFHTVPEAQDWIFVRDHKLDLIYFGWVYAYSDLGKERELILKEVQVYNNFEELVQESDVIYLARSRDDLTIETLNSIPVDEGNSQ